MTYQCMSGLHEEVVWNSRDGVTPFAIDCPQCGEEARHIDWGSDRYCPNFKPSDHPAVQRVFADITKPAAVKYAIERMKDFDGTEYELQGKERIDMQVNLANSFIGDVHCVPLTEVWVQDKDFMRSCSNE